MRRVCLAALTACAVVCLPATATTTPQTLRPAMEQVLQQEGLVGAVWSTVAADGTVRTGAAGRRDADTGAPMLPETRTQVGSVTKAVLALGVLRLVSEGRLSLDAPVDTLVPSLRFDNPWQATDPVRVRHLLEHAAGLESLYLWQFLSLRAQVDTPLAMASGSQDGPLRVQTLPGSRISYSNLGYTLLGQVLEAVTGERYESWMDREVLAPLAMHDSSFAFRSQHGAHADPQLAMGHFDGATTQPTVPSYLRPALQLTTTAADMAHFARFLLGDGRIGGQPFIQPALMTQLGGPGSTEPVRAGLPLGRGLVLVGRDRHGAVGDCHGGNTVGFWAMLCVFPHDGSAFFVATNTDSETANNDRLTRVLLDALALSRPVPTPTPPALDPVVSAWSGIYVRTPAVNMPGVAPLQEIVDAIYLDHDRGSLRLRSLFGPTRWLRGAGRLLFHAEGRSLPSHVLHVDGQGHRMLSDGFRHFERVPAWRVVGPGVLLLVMLAGFVGIMGAGLVPLLRRRLRRTHPLFWPTVSLLMLLLPLPLFFRQSFLALGDLTAASGLLAVVTVWLPLALLVGTWHGLRGWRRAGLSARVAILCVLSTLPGTVLLLAWGLLPLRLWQL